MDLTRINKLRENFPEKTIIIITHSKNTLKYCDKIYEIKTGKIKKIK